MNKINNKILKKINIKNGGRWTKGFFKINEKIKPLITIITVTLNSQKHLEETLISIFNQNYKNFELIIIDGKSNDKTLSIIKKYEHKIDYWMSEKDKGIYDAFNKGMNLARGQYIGIVNSDDLLNKNALTLLIKYIKKNIGIEICGSNALLPNLPLYPAVKFDAVLYLELEKVVVGNEVSFYIELNQSANPLDSGSVSLQYSIEKNT